VLVSRIRALERKRLGTCLQGDVKYARQRNIADVRTFEVALAQMQANAFRRDVLQGMVHRLDVHFGDLPESSTLLSANT
jgi:hypothetical protein